MPEPEQSKRFDHGSVKTFSGRFENFLLVKPGPGTRKPCSALVARTIPQVGQLIAGRASWRRHEAGVVLALTGTRTLALIGDGVAEDFRHAAR